MVLFLLAALLASAGDGVHPRGEPADYPAHVSGDGVTIAARVLRPEIVRQLLGADLTRGGYVVVELAAYPDEGRSVEVDARDFMLSVGSEEQGVRPAGPRTVADVMVGDRGLARPGGKSIELYPETNSGYSTGVDPVTGRRVNGTYAGGGIGVGIGGSGAPPTPGETANQRDGMARDLADNAFPDGIASEPVAGYLYFSKPTKKGKGPYELTWRGSYGKVQMTVPQPEKK